MKSAKKKYRVTMMFVSKITTEVEAKDEREAENIALDETDANMIALNSQTDDVIVTEIK